MTQRPASPGTPTMRDKFPVYPPRDDMQNPIHLHDPGHQAVLRRHFGNPGTTIVLGEVPVGWNPRQRRGVRIPDLLISFNIDRPQIIEQQGFSIEEFGKPPDFVLELASPTTGRDDYTVKMGWTRYPSANAMKAPMPAVTKPNAMLHPPTKRMVPGISVPVIAIATIRKRGMRNMALAIERMIPLIVLLPPPRSWFHATLGALPTAGRSACCWILSGLRSPWMLRATPVCYQDSE